MTASLTTVLFDVGDTLLWIDDAAVAAELGGGLNADAVREAVAKTRARVDSAVLSALECQAPPPGAGAPTPGAEAPTPEALLLSELGVPPQEQAAAGLRLRELDRRGGLWAVLPPGLEELLTKLSRKGLRLGVLSNSDGTVANKLASHGLDSHFEVVLDSALVGFAKPDPRIFQLGLARLGVAAQETLYVGDIYSLDVVAAERAGLRGLLFDRTRCYRPPCSRVETVAELALALL